MLFNVLTIAVLVPLSVGIAYSTFGAGNLGIAGACGFVILYWKLFRKKPVKKTSYVIMTVFTGINACVGGFPFYFAIFMWLKSK